MKLIGYGAAFALAISAVVSAQQPTYPSQDRPQTGMKDVTLTGCVVKGDGGYVLSNATRSPAGSPAGTSGTMPSQPGASSGAMKGQTYYSLGNDAQLAGHAGEVVEIVGVIEGDVPPEEIAIKPAPDGVNLELTVDGKKVAFLIPTASGAVGTSGSMTPADSKNVKVSNVDVKSVKTVADNCK